MSWSSAHNEESRKTECFPTCIGRISGTVPARYIYLSTSSSFKALHIQNTVKHRRVEEFYFSYILLLYFCTHCHNFECSTCTLANCKCIQTLLYWSFSGVKNLSTSFTTVGDPALVKRVADHLDWGLKCFLASQFFFFFRVHRKVLLHNKTCLHNQGVIRLMAMEGQA